MNRPEKVFQPMDLVGTNVPENEKISFISNQFLLVLEVLTHLQSKLLFISRPLNVGTNHSVIHWTPTLVTVLRFSFQIFQVSCHLQSFYSEQQIQIFILRGLPIRFQVNYSPSQLSITSSFTTIKEIRSLRFISICGNLDWSSCVRKPELHLFSAIKFTVGA